MHLILLWQRVVGKRERKLAGIWLRKSDGKRAVRAGTSEDAFMMLFLIAQVNSQIRESRFDESQWYRQLHDLQMYRDDSGTQLQ